MLAWHYTVGTKIPLILEDGFLRPATAGVMPPEKPIVWFSKNQLWEATANKMFRATDGTLRFGTRETTREMGGGLFRFGLPTEELRRWTELQREALIPTRTKRSLVNAAKKDGSNPYDWLGTLEPVQIDRCIIEVEDYEAGWIPSSAVALRALFD
jgi:hypothetical protein